MPVSDNGMYTPDNGMCTSDNEMCTSDNEMYKSDDGMYKSDDGMYKSDDEMSSPSPNDVYEFEYGNAFVVSMSDIIHNPRLRSVYEEHEHTGYVHCYIAGLIVLELKEICPSVFMELVLLSKYSKRPEAVAYFISTDVRPEEPSEEMMKEIRECIGISDEEKPWVVPFDSLALIWDNYNPYLSSQPTEVDQKGIQDALSG